MQRNRAGRARGHTPAGARAGTVDGTLHGPPQLRPGRTAPSRRTIIWRRRAATASTTGYRRRRDRPRRVPPRSSTATTARGHDVRGDRHCIGLERQREPDRHHESSDDRRKDQNSITVSALRSSPLQVMCHARGSTRQYASRARIHTAISRRSRHRMPSFTGRRESAETIFTSGSSAVRPRTLCYARVSWCRDRESASRSYACIRAAAVARRARIPHAGLRRRRLSCGCCSATREPPLSERQRKMVDEADKSCARLVGAGRAS